MTPRCSSEAPTRRHAEALHLLLQAAQDVVIYVIVMAWWGEAEWAGGWHPAGSDMDRSALVAWLLLSCADTYQHSCGDPAPVLSHSLSPSISLSLSPSICATLLF